jgi:hypothetical protein
MKTIILAGKAYEVVNECGQTTVLTAGDDPGGSRSGCVRRTDRGSPPDTIVPGGAERTKPMRAEEMWAEIARRDRREYERRRAARPRKSGRSGTRINGRRRSGGHFVGVDSEGFNLTHEIKGRGREKTEWRL